MTAFEMTAVDEPDTILDVITFTGGAISYSTGQAQTLVEARLQQLPSKADVMASLSDWSNGYLSVRAVPSTFDDRLTGTPIPNA